MWPRKKGVLELMLWSAAVVPSAMCKWRSAVTSGCWTKTSGLRTWCPQLDETFLVISCNCQMQWGLSCLFLCKCISDIVQSRLTFYLVFPKVLQISRIPKFHLAFADILFSFYCYTLLPYVGKKDKRFLLYLAYVNFTLFLSQKNRDPLLGL